MKTRILLSLFCLMLHVTVFSQVIHLHGRVQDGFTKQFVPGVKVSLHKPDSTLVNDSLPLTYTMLGGNRGGFAIYTAEVKEPIKNYLIHASADGYNDIWEKIQGSADAENNLEIPMIGMLKARELKEVSVVATKVKMFYKGDTLVYDATAFKLPDGSMLDALIAQLPGVELKAGGEIFVNGRKVNELLLGSRSFMHGNKKVLMENLPYYTVKNIKVYDKLSDLDEALGHTDGAKTLVMDVNLKEEYQVGYIANVEAAGGTDKRWLGRGFLLGFTDRWRYTLLGNANNVNESQHIGQSGSWSPQQMPTSMTTTKGVKAEADYASKDRNVNNTTFAEYTYSDVTTDMHSRRETFLDGMTPHSLSESNTRSQSHRITLRNDFLLRKPYISVETHLSHYRVNGHSRSDFQQWNDTLTTRMLTSSMDAQTTMQAYLTAMTGFALNKGKGGEIIANFLVNYYKDDTERASEHRVDQLSYSTVARNSNDIHNLRRESNVGLTYRRSLGKDGWNLDASTGYAILDRKSRDYLYHPDTLALPSHLELLAAMTDPNNSYDYRYVHHSEYVNLSLLKYTSTQIAPGMKMAHKSLSFGVGIPMIQQHLNYHRSAIDTLARRNTVYFNPNAKFEHKFGKSKRNQINVSAGFNTHEIDLLQTIAYRDDSQPLIVNLGNANLKPRQTSEYSFDYANHNGPHKQEVSFNTRLNYRHRDIGQSLSYNTTTGVYTYQPINVHGGYTWSNGLNYSRNLDQKNSWSVQSNANASLHHSLDHTMFADETESHLNAVNTLTVGEKAYIKYNKDALNLRATGSISWRHSEGKMVDFETLDAFDYQYGLNGYYTIPKLKTTLFVDATMYSRRGYGSSELNTDDFVLNASLSQPFLKGKLIARIEAFDLLHQLSNTQYAVNAQGRTITWYRSLPHYAMLHLVYHWNKNPKKK